MANPRARKQEPSQAKVHQGDGHMEYESTSAKLQAYVADTAQQRCCGCLKSVVLLQPVSALAAHDLRFTVGRDV